MLTLTIKNGNFAIITTPTGEEMRVSVRDIRRNQVRIGFEAPESWTIERDKVYDERLAKEAQQGRDK